MIDTCTHTYDNGGTCSSVSAKDHNYCVYHLRHRALLLRMAKARARSERFNLKLPPLESMQAVQSALSQLAEALAADMIDLRRADRLIRVLNSASRNLLKADKWAAPVFHSDQAASVDVTSEYGLPQGLDLDTPPEVAFPAPPDLQSVIPSEERSDESRDPFVSPHRPGSPTPAPLSSMPTVSYCKDGPGCPDHTIRADFPYTPETEELHDVLETEGNDAAIRLYRQQQRNRHLRYVRASRKRYAAIALEKNMRLAAERLAERQLAEKQAQEKLAAKKPPAPAPAGIDEYLAGKEATTA